MADKKFSGVSGAVSSPELTADFNGAKVFSNVRVGAMGVYYGEGLRTKYIPFDYMERVFIRIQEVSGKLCCGSTVFHYFRLVFVHEGKEFADVIFTGAPDGTDNTEKIADEALECIHNNAPEIKIGVERKEE